MTAPSTPTPSTPPVPHHLTHLPLPASITVRNLFPPLVAIKLLSSRRHDSRCYEESVDEEGYKNSNEVQGKGSEELSDDEHEIHQIIQEDEPNESDNDSMEDTLNDNDIIEPLAIRPTIRKKDAPLEIEDRCAFVAREVLLPLRLDIVIKKPLLQPQPPTQIITQTSPTPPTAPSQLTQLAEESKTHQNVWQDEGGNQKVERQQKIGNEIMAEDVTKEHIENQTKTQMDLADHVHQTGEEAIQADKSHQEEQGTVQESSADLSEEQVIYSHKLSYGTAHPRWDHLNEQISLVGKRGGYYNGGGKDGNQVKENNDATDRSRSNNTDVGNGDNTRSDNTTPNGQPNVTSETLANAVETSAATPTELGATSEEEKWQNVYPYLYARFVILDAPSNTIPSTTPPTTKTSKSNVTLISSTKDPTAREWILAEIPLYPTKLRSLPSSSTSSTNVDNDRMSNNNDNGNSNMIQIPSSLPPNAILIHYTDGNTRILPILFSVLVRKGVIIDGGDGKSNGLDSRGNDEKGEVDRGDGRRFSDKVFDALGPGKDENDDNNDVGNPALREADGVSSKGGATNKGQSKMTTTLPNTNSKYGDDKVFDLLGKDEDVTTSPKKSAGDDGIHGQIQLGTNIPTQIKHDVTMASTSVFDDRAFDLVGGRETEPKTSAGPDVNFIATVLSDIALVDDVSTVPSAGDGESDLEEVQSVEAILTSRPDATTTSELSQATMQDDSEAMQQQEELAPSESNKDAPLGIPEVDPASPRPPSLAPTIPPSPTSTVLPPLPPLPIMNGSEPSTSDALSKVKNEVDELRRLVQREQMLLELEQQRILQETNHLKNVMLQVEQMHSEIEENNRAAGMERVHIFRSNFRLEAHRMTLLQQLQIIFPIKLTPIEATQMPPFASANTANRPRHQHTIVGLPLPDDIHNPTITDDQVSAALGFTCHLIVLTSKYLSISLRYPIICKFSRSAIIDDKRRINPKTGKSTYSVYPLFRERVVEREQLDHALVLLSRNVECLLKTRNVAFRVEWNVLAKMDRLLLRLVEGEDPAFANGAS